MRSPSIRALSALLLIASPALGQVDQELAAAWFDEARALCERDDGRLWGVSLCGPMVIADATTGTLATNRPAPDAERPQILGYANAALPWGGEWWSTFVWQHFPRDDAHLRGRLMLHELFHRVQRELGLFTPDGDNAHLDTLAGRYWLQLEWRALAEALRRHEDQRRDGEERLAALRDAIAFRDARRARFEHAAEMERREEIREGLAQYTGTVAAASSHEEAVADALDQLATTPEQPTLVRVFAYTSGAAYGLLLDELARGWRQRVDVESDLGEMLSDAAGIEPASDLEAAEARYNGAELHAAEERREAEHLQRVAELRARFVEGPVLVVSRGRNASFSTAGSTAIPGAGTTLASYRVTAEWGSVEADTLLVVADGETLVLPAPDETEGTVLRGDGWTIELAEGWRLGPGPREGDYRLVR